MMHIFKPGELNEIVTLLEQGLLYRKVFLLDNYCRKNCGKNCKDCIHSDFKLDHTIIEFSEFDESKHLPTREAAESVLGEIQKNLEPIYEKIRQLEPKEIEWHGQGHESDGYCPTCGKFLGNDQDLAFTPVERCPKCGQLFGDEDE